MLETLILAFFIVDLFAGTKLRNNSFATILVLKLQSENQSFVIMKSILRFIVDETAKEKTEAAFHEILSAF